MFSVTYLVCVSVCECDPSLHDQDLIFNVFTRFDFHFGVSFCRGGKKKIKVDNSSLLSFGVHNIRGSLYVLNEKWNGTVAASKLSSSRSSRSRSVKCLIVPVMFGNLDGLFLALLSLRLSRTHFCISDKGPLISVSLWVSKVPAIILSNSTPSPSCAFWK